MLASFFFQAEDGIRDLYVTGVQTCALPISMNGSGSVDGVFVTPWPVYQTFPVGLAGVPPQVQVVAAWADAAPQPLAASDAAAIAVTATIARGLMCPVSFHSRREMARDGPDSGGPGSAAAIAFAAPAHSERRDRKSTRL